jgi:hypothetical protein
MLAGMADAFAFNQLPRQKAGNLLCALETVMLLITTQAPPGNAPNRATMTPADSSQVKGSVFLSYAMHAPSLKKT